MSEPLESNLKYYGVSPWEIEVIYGYLNARFKVVQEEIEQDDPEFVSMLNLEIPLAFSEEFFKWFDFRRWEKIKALFKEMKRRRGGRKAIKIHIVFVGNPIIKFLIDTEDSQWFNNAVEKIDFVLELIPYHLDPSKLPENVNEVNYHYDVEAKRWRLDTAYVGKRKFVFETNGWKMIT